MTVQAQMRTVTTMRLGRIMGASKWVTGLVVGAVIATGCGGDNERGASGSRPGDDTTEVGAFPTAGAVLFEDAFDDDRNGWGVVDHPEYGTTAYEGGDYVWVFRGRVAHWIPAVLGERYDHGELDMRDVVVRAEATIVQGGGVIGVACRETPDTDADFQWYEFVARDGFAAIRHADDHSNIDVLAETHDIALRTGEPIAFEASCTDDVSGDVHLSLTLNGDPVLQATDTDPLGNGVPALQAWTHPLHEQMDIRWHRFSVHRPRT